MGPSIDVVIPVYGHYELTNSCLEQLQHQTMPHVAIVVDDGSTDETSASLSRDWPEVQVVGLKANRGYTKAVNRGAEAGNGKYIVLLNNDVHLEPNSLAHLVSPMEADPRVGSVAALMLRPGQEVIDSFGVTADRTLAGFARLQGHPSAEAFKDGPVLTGPEGTAGAYRRSAWEQVGGLDETIIAYMEILDLALRLHAAQWGTIGQPQAVGVHLGSRTYGRRSAEQRQLAGFSRGYLLRRYGVFWTRAGIRTLLTETAVVLGDFALCHDLQALSGRLRGWRAGRGCARYPWPPDGAIDRSISLPESFRLRQNSRLQE